jgi:hypothetical protein
MQRRRGTLRDGVAGEVGEQTSMTLATPNRGAIPPLIQRGDETGGARPAQPVGKTATDRGEYERAELTLLAFEPPAA